MPEVTAPVPSDTSGTQGGSMWPTTGVGRAGVVAAIIALVCSAAIVLVTIVFRGTSPIIDSWIWPVVALVLIDAAALLNVLAVWLRRERSAVSLLALVVTVAIGGLLTLIVVGDALAAV
jgi:hypothetical protein